MEFYENKHSRRQIIAVVLEKVQVVFEIRKSMYPHYTYQNQLNLVTYILQKL